MMCDLQFRRKSVKQKLRKGDGKIIRALIRRALRYLQSKPAPAPMKCIFLQKMYEIESAVDLAVNFSYNSNQSNNKRKRGVWQWYNCDIRTMSENNENNTNNENETKKSEDSKQNEKAKDNKGKKKGKWVQFPAFISDQIEAVYLKRLADLVSYFTCIAISYSFLFCLVVYVYERFYWY